MSQGKSDPKTNIAMIYRPNYLSSKLYLLRIGQTNSEVLLQKKHISNEKSKLCKDKFNAIAKLITDPKSNLDLARLTRFFFLAKKKGMK